MPGAKALLTQLLEGVDVQPLKQPVLIVDLLPTRWGVQEIFIQRFLFQLVGGIKKDSYNDFFT